MSDTDLIGGGVIGGVIGYQKGFNTGRKQGYSEGYQQTSWEKTQEINNLRSEIFQLQEQLRQLKFKK